MSESDPSISNPSTNIDNPGRTENLPFLRLTQLDWGTVGVYPDAPEGLADQLANLGPTFLQNQADDPKYDNLYSRN